MDSVKFKVIVHDKDYNKIEFTICVSPDECVLDVIEKYLRNCENSQSQIYTLVSIVLMKTTCEGCRNNQPNQLAHMDVGGCMYDENN